MRKLTQFRVNIFMKLMSISLLLVVVPLLVVSISGTSIFSRSIEKETISNMQASAENKLDLLKQVIEGAKREGYAVAQDATAISLLTSLSDGEQVSTATKQRVNDYLKGILLKSNGMYENLFYTDNKGIVVADGTDGKANGVNISDRDYFVNSQKNGNIEVSDVVISKSTQRPSMVVAVPLFDSNKRFLGVFAMPLEFTKLTELLVKRTDGVNYNYIIFNSQGDVIAHENKDLIFKSNMTKEDPSQKRLFDEMNKGTASFGFYTKSGVEKAMAYTPFKDKNWYICTAIVKGDYLEPLTQFKRNMFLVAGICLLAAGGLMYFFSRSVANPLKYLSKVAGAIAAGDLTQPLRRIKSRDEIGKLAADFSNMLQNLRKLITEVRDTSSDVAASSEEMLASTEEASKASKQIAITVDELANGASEQAVTTEKGNARIMEVVSGLGDISKDMSQSERLIQAANHTVEAGKETIEIQKVKMNENKQVAMEVATAIGELSEKSTEIGNILAGIKSISDKTNILSLNAAIEAARAGEHGRGFAVVASEIRKLAEQSNLSVQKSTEIIEEIQKGVRQSVSEMGKVRLVVEDQEKALANTVAAFENITDVVTNISANVRKVAEVTTALDGIAKEAGDAMSEIASFSQETAAASQEVAASTEEQASVIQQLADSSGNLAGLAVELQKSIGEFKI